MSKKERKLTPAELERKVHYEKMCEEMEQKGYKKYELIIGVVKANVMAIFIMLPFVGALAWIYCLVNPEIEAAASSNSTLLACGALMVLIVAHELIHGATWAIFAPNHFKSISFGVIWKMLTPYCTCSEPLKKWQYVIGALMPTLVLGFGIGAVAIAMNNFLWFLVAELMVFSGGGDFYIVAKILLHKTKGAEVLYFDHPYECGTVVFER